MILFHVVEQDHLLLGLLSGGNLVGFKDKQRIPTYIYGK